MNNEIENRFKAIAESINKMVDEMALSAKMAIHDRCVVFRCGESMNRVDEVKMIEEYLSRKEYVKTPKFWIKGFVAIWFEDNQMIIKHDIPNSNPYRIKTGMLTECVGAIRYFESI